MSEDAVAAPKKKRSKLPIMVAFVVMFAGGGFFVLKSRAPASDKPVKIELAEKETELEEFLTNTSNPSVYVRAKLSLRLRKDYDEAKIKANEGDIRDAVILVLNSTNPGDVTDSRKRGRLKKILAEAINTALEGPLEDPKAPKAPPADTSPKRKGKLTERQLEPEKPAATPPAKDMELDWDSQTGPVMKVRFLSLATQ